MNTIIPNLISLTEAIEVTRRFRADPGKDLPVCETFSKDALLALLAQPGAQSFRIYFGRKADNSICSILVAADTNGKDILPPLQNTGSINVDQGIILEDAIRCPPICPPSSPVNE